MEDKNTYYCESCGSIMEFDAVSQTLKCPHCGNQIEIQNRAETIIEHPLTIDATRKIRVEEKETKTLECSGCGAIIEVSQFDATMECPYCGSSYVLATNQEDTLVPDGVIPFQIDARQLKEIFQKWIKKRWFAPNALKHLYQRDKFAKIYVPYWTFDAKVKCPYSGRGGRTRIEHYKDSEGNDQTRTTTDWYYVSGRIDHFFDDIQIPASKRFRSGLFSGIEPFSFEQLKSYSKQYLSGYMAENYSISLEEGHNDAKKEMKSELVSMAEREILSCYDMADSVHITPTFSKETYKYVLVPIYSTSYQFKNRQYTVVINGQNGRVKGEYPKSVLKITLAIVAGILAFLLAFGLLSGGESKEVGVASQLEQTAVVWEENGQIEVEEKGVIMAWDYSQDNLPM